MEDRSSEVEELEDVMKKMIKWEVDHEVKYEIERRAIDDACSEKFLMLKEAFMSGKEVTVKGKTYCSWTHFVIAFRDKYGIDKEEIEELVGQAEIRRIFERMHANEPANLELLRNTPNSIMRRIYTLRSEWSQFGYKNSSFPPYFFKLE